MKRGNHLKSEEGSQMLTGSRSRRRRFSLLQQPAFTIKFEPIDSNDNNEFSSDPVKNKRAILSQFETLSFSTGQWSDIQPQLAEDTTTSAHSERSLTHREHISTFESEQVDKPKRLFSESHSDKDSASSSLSSKESGCHLPCISHDLSAEVESENKTGVPADAGQLPNNAPTADTTPSFSRKADVEGSAQTNTQVGQSEFDRSHREASNLVEYKVENKTHIDGSRRTVIPSRISDDGRTRTTSLILHGYHSRDLLGCSKRRDQTFPNMPLVTLVNSIANASTRKSHSMPPPTQELSSDLFLPRDALQTSSINMGIYGFEEHAEAYAHRDRAGYFSSYSVLDDMASTPISCASDEPSHANSHMPSNNLVFSDKAIAAASPPNARRRVLGFFRPSQRVGHTGPQRKGESPRKGKQPIGSATEDVLPSGQGSESRSSSLVVTPERLSQKDGRFMRRWRHGKRVLEHKIQPTSPNSSQSPPNDDQAPRLQRPTSSSLDFQPAQLPPFPSPDPSICHEFECQRAPINSQRSITPPPRNLKCHTRPCDQPYEIAMHKSNLSPKLCGMQQRPTSRSFGKIPQMLTTLLHQVDKDSKSQAPAELIPSSLSNACEGPYLGPPKKEHRGRHTLVLDLDETLVHSSFVEVANYNFIVPVEIEGNSHMIYVGKRPGVDDFLKAVSQKYEVVIFTASLAKYADPLMDKLDPNRLCVARLFRERCTIWNNQYVKDLSKMGRDVKKVLIVDNSPNSYAFQPKNAIPIESWFDDPTDRELFELIPILNALAKVDDLPTAIQKSIPSCKDDYI